MDFREKKKRTKIKGKRTASGSANKKKHGEGKRGGAQGKKNDGKDVGAKKEIIPVRNRHSKHKKGHSQWGRGEIENRLVGWKKF